MGTDLNSNPSVEVLYKTNAGIGEAPFFEEETNQLLWVDITGQTINFLNLDDGENRVLECSDTVSAVFPVEGSQNLLVALGQGLYIMDRETGKIERMLCSVENDKPNRINDAKCDSSGRVWFGTMMREPVFGQESGAALYSYAKGSLTKFHSVLVSNGMAWNLADDKMYYIDTFKKCIYIYTYSKESGLISDREVHIDYSQDDALSLPDGMCTDKKGRLWVASTAGGQRVTCWDQETKEKVMTVMIPGAKDITSCCFGGPNYEWLFVTSARHFLSKEELETFTDSGSLFVIKDLGTHGRQANKFKL